MSASDEQLIWKQTKITNFDMSLKFDKAELKRKKEGNDKIMK